MERFIDYIESSCSGLGKSHSAYRYKKKVLDEMTERANEITRTGLKDEKVLCDIITEEYPDLFVMSDEGIAHPVSHTVPAGKEQEAQQQSSQTNPMNSPVMKWFFPLFSLFICLSYNAAFALYWVVSNLIHLVQNQLINWHLDRQDRLAKENITGTQLFAALRPVFGRDISCGNIVYDNQPEMLKLTSRQSKEYDVWSLANIPLEINGHSYKLADFATVEKGLSPQKVAKEDQQYRLCLQYEYIGSGEQGRKLLKKDLEEFNAGLPMGYMAEDEQQSWSWGQKDNKQYALLLIVIAIIFFTTSILFNSLKQPLAIIFVIPISYIGVFLTFYLFGLNFDQGGFASFVLLCGITVNASIYIMNEYNDIRNRFPKLKPVRAFVKAWNVKIIPIFLTVVSTILGFIPFMVGTGKEAFWFPLAAGTIGGLIMSVLGIFIFLPIFTLKKERVLK